MRRLAVARSRRHLAALLLPWVILLGCLAAVPARAQGLAMPPAAAGPARAQPINAAVLSRTSGIERITLSPDGRLVAVAAKATSEQGLVILDAADRHVVRTLKLPPLHQLEWYAWVGSGRLVMKLLTSISFRGFPARGARLMAYDIAAQTMRDLGHTRLVPLDDIVIHRDPLGQFLLVTTRPGVFGPPEVRRIALGPGDNVKPQLVQPAFKSVRQWIADAAGVIRYGLGGRNDKRLTIWYRGQAGEELQRLTDWPVDPFITDYAVRLAVSPSAPDALMLERGSDGRVVLTRRPLAGTGTVETLYAPAGRDVTAFDFDRAGHLVSVLEEDDRPQVHWFDPVLQKVQDKLERALGGGARCRSCRAPTTIRGWWSGPAAPAIRAPIGSMTWVRAIWRCSARWPRGSICG